METAELVLEYLKVLIWPVLTFVVILIFRKHIFEVLLRIQKADLPGGVSLNFSEQIKLAHQVSMKLDTPKPSEKKKDVPIIPPTEANFRMVELGLQPSPSGLDANYYRILALQDPNLALAGLRIEIDILTRNIAKGFEIDIEDQTSLRDVIEKLYDKNAITSEQMNLTINVLDLSNAAIHGQSVSFTDSIAIIDVVEVLTESYLSWLSWGFDDNWLEQE